jgi:type IV secretory pathway VirB2 component (pilin)
VGVSHVVCRALLATFDLKKHLEVIVIGIVIITTAPVIYKLFFGKKNSVPAKDPYQKS